MFNYLLEKCGDWLLPIIAGLAVWYGVHYLVLTPRIIIADVRTQYTFDTSLPHDVNACLKSRLAGEMLAIGRFEAALYTASFKHILNPLQEKHDIAFLSLDGVCGVSLARQKKKERDAYLSDQARRKAEEERKRKDMENTLKFWGKLLFGDK